MKWLGPTTVLLTSSNTDAIDVHAAVPGIWQLPFRMPKTEKKLHVVWRDYDDWYSMLNYASFDAELTQTGASQRLKLDTNYTELVMDRQGHPLLGLFEPTIATGYFGEVYIAFARYGTERGIGMTTNYEEPGEVVVVWTTNVLSSGKLVSFVNSNNVIFCISLKGYADWQPWNSNCHYDIEYIQKVKPFVKALINKFWNVDPDAYRRILVYQVDNEMNHEIYTPVFGELWIRTGVGHHPWWNRDLEITLLAGGSKAIRDAEIEMSVAQRIGKTTLICINPSYDIIANGMGRPEQIPKGYDGLKYYLKLILDKPEARVDLIGLDYYPGTWVLGVTENDLKEIVMMLCDDFGTQSSYHKKIVVAETGFSTWGYRPESHQKNFYRTITSYLVNYYQNDGKEKGFVGIMWYEFISKDEGGAPHEEYFGVLVRDPDGTVYRTKEVWGWLKNDIHP
ncbi:MAG: hypothetical protein QXU48_01440 [Thermoplasmata archaeon]